MTDKNNILLMIPDYLEGRLSAQDRLIVETSIDQDAEFAAEFEFQKNIKAALLANIDINVSDELGWARLKKEIRGIVTNILPPMIRLHKTID